MPLSGGEAESIAARLLESQGYRILARNVRSKRGELDLVARDWPIVCFVEVRLRRTSGLAAESVDAGKRASLARAAERYLLANRLGDASCRFDVVTVDAGGRALLIRDAF